MRWQRELNLAVEAAKSAGNFLRMQKGKKDILSSKGRDIKLRADRESETIILESLKVSDYPVLAEESGQHGVMDSQLPVWIVDPLDGTLNFSRGLPLCCISIALWQGEKPILGVIYDFNGEELFVGLVGKGAWCGERGVSVSDISVVENAVLGTGFQVGRNFSDESLKGFLARVQRFKKVRLLGSAALSLAYVACGRIDAYMEEDIMLWDIAAGAALVLAAGGSVEVQPSTSLKWARDVRCASRASIWEKLENSQKKS